MAAEKFHSLLSASWRLWKAGSIIQSESKGLRTRGADGVNPSLRAEGGEMTHLSSEAGVGWGRGEFLLPLSSLSGLDDASSGWLSDLLY